MIDIEQRPTLEESTRELEEADSPGKKDVPVIRRKTGNAVRAVEKKPKKRVPLWLRQQPPAYRKHTISDGLLVPFPGSHGPINRSHTISDGLLVRPPGSPDTGMDDDDD